MNILNLLSSSDYLIINKSLVKEIGINETILLSELISEYNYWLSNNGLDDEEMFFSTVENVEENTTLNDYAQRKALNNLVEKELIELKIKGIPARRFIKIKTKNIEKLFTENNNNLLRTSSKNFKELEVKNLKTNINNNKINNKDNNILDKSKILLSLEKNTKKDLLKGTKSLVKKKTKKEILYDNLINNILVKFNISYDNQIKELLVKWLKGLYQINKLPSESSLESSLIELSKYSRDIIIKSINESIRGDYKTFYISNKNNDCISTDGINKNPISIEERMKQENSSNLIQNLFANKKNE